jgi:DNA-binding MarR family transcriptional regulator
VLAALEHKHMIEHCTHPTHGHILQVTLTHRADGRLQAANPAARALEAAIEDGFTADEIATVKTWLVEAAKRL